MIISAALSISLAMEQCRHHAYDIFISLPASCHDIVAKLHERRLVISWSYLFHLRESADEDCYWRIYA